LALSTWSLAKLAEFLVAEGMVDVSHERLRELLKREAVSFQAVKTWKQSTDPDYEGETNRVLELADIAELVEYHLVASAWEDDTAHATPATSCGSSSCWRHVRSGEGCLGGLRSLPVLGRYRPYRLRRSPLR